MTQSKGNFTLPFCAYFVIRHGSCGLNATRAHATATFVEQHLHRQVRHERGFRRGLLSSLMRLSRTATDSPTLSVSSISILMARPEVFAEGAGQGAPCVASGRFVLRRELEALVPTGEHAVPRQLARIAASGSRLTSLEPVAVEFANRMAAPPNRPALRARSTATLVWVMRPASPAQPVLAALPAMTGSAARVGGDAGALATAGDGAVSRAGSARWTAQTPAGAGRSSSAPFARPAPGADHRDRAGAIW